MQSEASLRMRLFIAQGVPDFHVFFGIVAEDCVVCVRSLFCSFRRRFSSSHKLTNGLR